MRCILLFLLLSTAVEVAAQERCCNSYEDFVAGQWREIPSVRMIAHSFSHQFWVGGSDYKITSDDKATAKMLKKETLVVEYHDTLYVNLRRLCYKKIRMGRGYTRAVRLGDNKLAFAARTVGSRMRSVMIWSFLGIVGSAISENYAHKNKVIYIIDNPGNGKKIPVKLLDNSTYKDSLLESE